MTTTSSADKAAALRGRVRGTWIAALAIVAGGVGELSAQGGLPADTAAAPISARAPLVQSSDLVLGAVFLASFGAIWVEEVDELIAPHPEGTDTFARSFGRRLGNSAVVAGLTGATFLIGKATGSETTARVGLRSLESFLLTAGLTSVIKIGLGRARPDSEFDSRHFHPLAFEHSFWSFPSGHTANVFALATTLSLELGDEAPWLPYVAYPLAGWTGLTRILDGEHWLTDVVAAAAVGIFS
ncbi:MAG: phosphatase PAP2 family protein, partial [Gemmatimonadota bacterium]